MTNSQLTIHPCGLIAQWIEHCTGIARSWVRVPFKPEFFFRMLFQLFKLKAHCEDHNFTHMYLSLSLIQKTADNPYMSSTYPIQKKFCNFILSVKLSLTCPQICFSLSKETIQLVTDTFENLPATVISKTTSTTQHFLHMSPAVISMVYLYVRTYV